MRTWRPERAIAEDKEVDVISESFSTQVVNNMVPSFILQFWYCLISNEHNCGADTGIGSN